MTTFLRNGTSVDDPRLGRLPSAVTAHLERYPLTAATMPSEATPVVIGVNWYENADRPVKRRIAGRDRWVIGEGPLGNVRGGHAVCLKPHGVTDLVPWWVYYNQGSEGRCVEFAWLRALTLMNRMRFDITSAWHYWMMQYLDEWRGGMYPGGMPRYEGTSVRAGGEVMQNFGAIVSLPRGRPLSEGWPDAPQFVPGQPHPAVQWARGIHRYRWAKDWQDVRAVTKTPDNLPGVVMLNSWGKGYPKETLLLDDFGARLLAEDGEMAVATDR